MLCPLGPFVHPPHSIPLRRNLRVSASVFEDGGWKSGWGSHPNFQKHRTENRNGATTDPIVRIYSLLFISDKVWQRQRLSLFGFLDKSRTSLSTWRDTVFVMFVFVFASELWFLSCIRKPSVELLIKPSRLFTVSMQSLTTRRCSWHRYLKWVTNLTCTQPHCSIAVASFVLHYIIIFSLVLVHLHQPLSRSLNADVPEQLITPLVSLGHISMLAPDQFASPMKSIVANFIVKDLLMNDRVCAGLNAHRHFCGCDWRFKVKTFLIFIILQSAGDKNGKLWTTDEEVSPEVLAKVRERPQWCLLLLWPELFAIYVLLQSTT